MKFIAGLLMLLLFTSCATIFNKKTCKVNFITTPGDSKIVYKDSIYESPVTLNVKRSKEPLKITQVYDTIKKDYTIKASPNGQFLYGNLAGLEGLLVFVPIPYLIDLTNPKRFYYGSNLELNLYDTLTVIRPKISRGYYNVFHDAFDKIPKGWHKNTLKFSPLNPADVYFPALQISYERLLLKKLSAQIEFGYVLNTSYKDQTGFKIRAEIREYLNYRKYAASYFGFEIFYSNTQYHYDGYFHTPQDTFCINGYMDNVKIKKKLYGLNFKFGRQYTFQHFVFEWYVGIGAKYRDVVESERENLNDIKDRPRDLNVWYAGNMPGRSWVVNVPINFKIGYRF
jgi:hypothetical protein